MGGSEQVGKEGRSERGHPLLWIGIRVFGVVG